MEPIYIGIDKELTGKNIKKMMKEHGYSVKDFQEIFGFEYPASVYYWLEGKCVPSLENLLLLGRLFKTDVADIVVCNIEDEALVNRTVEVQLESGLHKLDRHSSDLLKMIGNMNAILGEINRTVKDNTRGRKGRSGRRRD